MPYKNKEKQKQYQREWVAKRKSDFFLNKFCIKCGAKENLELDHIDPSKKLSHRIWSWSEQRRLDEIAKCQILCETCHGEKTKINRDGVTAKLSEEEVFEIFDLYKTQKYSFTELGKMYGVNRKTITLICYNVTWRHLSLK